MVYTLKMSQESRRKIRNMISDTPLCLRDEIGGTAVHRKLGSDARSRPGRKQIIVPKTQRPETRMSLNVASRKAYALTCFDTAYLIRKNSATPLMTTRITVLLHFLMSLSSQREDGRHWCLS